MTVNSSPWIFQLNKDRIVTKLSKDIKTDIVIVGAGIAGVSTAFFLLKNTDKKIVIVDAYMLAHGATGHNAGQITSYFERPLSDIVEEFGLKMASEGQRAVEESWALLDEMYTDAGLSLPLARFKGHAGLVTEKQILQHLENNYLRRQANLTMEEIVISEEASFLPNIGEKYKNLYSVVPQQEIMTRLETFDPQYKGVTSFQKGVMNSALFCEEVADFLLKKYSDRFSLFEHTPIAKVVLKKDKVLLDAIEHTITADKVVLCTNGFDNLEIFTSEGLALDTRFHHSVDSVVAFMSGFLETFKDPPTAISYFQEEESGLTSNPGDPYFYMTRRPYEYEKNIKHNLVCVGGPDFRLEDRSNYSRDFDYPENAQERIDNFIKKTYDKPKDLKYTFMWHGLMGYTTNMLRMIGPDPDNKRLLYNLGCNGVGILPSIFGGEKISKIVKGEKFSASIFDVRERKL